MYNKKLFFFRFIANLTEKRRQNAEKLAEKALSDAKKKQEEAAKAAAEAAAKEAKQNGVSAPTTPATSPTSPTGLREGITLCHMQYSIYVIFLLYNIY